MVDGVNLFAVAPKDKIQTNGFKLQKKIRKMFLTAKLSKLRNWLFEW